MIRASASYTSGWGSFVLLKMDRVRVAWGGSLSMLHRVGLALVLRYLKCLPDLACWILHWILLSFMEAAYMVNHAQDTKDPRGMISLAQIHKRSPFYPDISFQEYKHLTILPLMPPTEDGLGLYRYAKNLSAPFTRDQIISARVER